jgi:hypothetical protein
VAAPRPRRVSGPARSPGARAAAAPAGIAVGALGALESVATHPLLDRLIRGRLWIGILAFALIGIVTLQLGLLKLNSGIGRSIERAATLERENAALSIEDSELAGGERVETQAARVGMQLSSISALHFLSSQPSSDVRRAAQVLSQPLQQAPAGAGEATTAQAPETSTTAAGEAPATGAEATGGTAEHRSAGEAAGGETAPSTSATGTTAPAGGASGGEAAAPSTATSTATSSPQAEVGGGTAAPGG